jgi:hypothetical protein
LILDQSPDQQWISTAEPVDGGGEAVGIADIQLVGEHTGDAAPGQRLQAEAAMAVRLALQFGVKHRMRLPR